MPRFDKTGPRGKGSKTGMGLGDCDDKKSVRAQSNQNNDSWIDIVLRVLGKLKK